MNKERKLLKEYSVVILILTALSLVRLIVDLFAFGGLDASKFPATGLPQEVVKITLIISFVIALVFFIPEVFVGVRGLKEAENPTGKSGHIVWALILAIFSAVATISAVIDIFSGFDTGKLLEVIDVALDAVIFFMYFLTAKKVANNK